MHVFGADIPFATHCRVESIEAVEGRTRLRVDLGPEHMNHLGIAHGGIICTLLDIALGTVARLAVGRPVITLDIQVSFISPGRGVLIGEGRIVRAGRSVVFAEADVRTEDTGELVAKATGLLKPTSLQEKSESSPDGSGNRPGS